MPKTPEARRGVLGQFWHWLKSQWVAEVPENVAVCEFECRKNECRDGEWATCERRIPRLAGEATPPPTESA